MARCVITGNRLLDGAVVWRGPEGAWSTDIAEADIHADEAGLAKALEAAQRDQAEGGIIGAYEVELTNGPGGGRPLRLRERIRAQGPTVEAF